MSFTLRPATIDDCAAIAHVHVAGKRASYENLADAAYLESLDPAEYEGKWRQWMSDEKMAVTVAIDDDNGTIAGFISTGPLRTPPPGMSPIRPLYTGEVYAIYILPAYWRQGIGEALMSAGAQTLKSQKHGSLCLWVLDGNKRATAFYKKMGGQKCGTTKVEIGGKMLPEGAYGWRDTRILIKDI